MKTFASASTKLVTFQAIDSMSGSTQAATAHKKCRPPRNYFDKRSLIIQVGKFAANDTGRCYLSQVEIGAMYLYGYRRTAERSLHVYPETSLPHLGFVT